MEKIKKILGLILIAFVIIGTLIGMAYALDYDDNDEFMLSQGDSIEGSFVVYDANSMPSVETSFQWVSFSPTSQQYITSDNLVEISDGAYEVKYYITIPDDAEVGVYRTVFTIKEGSDVTFFNLKLSVQHPPISALEKFFRSINPYWLSAVILLIFGFVFWWWRYH
jgi:hypothetical protein